MGEASPLRFLCVAELPPDRALGASGTQVRLVEWLQKLGHEVDAVWRDDLPRRVRHENLHDVVEKPVVFRKAIQSRCSRSQYDVICVNQPMCYLAAKDHRLSGRQGVFVRWTMGLEYGLERALAEWLPRWGLRKRSGWKTVPGELLDWMVYRQEVAAARYADGHVVLCERDRQYLMQDFGVHSESIVNVRQAPLEHFIEYPVKPLTPERMRHILTVGQFVPYKGIFHTGQIASSVLVSDPRLHFTWAGCSVTHSEVASLVATDVLSRVHVPGRLSDDEFRRTFDSHGVFLFPSIAEGFGKAFLEAMARGLCVVATNVGGMRDVIEHGRTGFLAEAGDVESMIRYVRLLTEDFGLAQKMSLNALAVSRTYSWQGVAARTVDFCRELLTRKQGVRLPG